MRPRPNVERIPATAHGGIDYAELDALGISPDEVTDFSVSVNPFGPPPGIEEAISRAAINRYPDSESSALRDLIAEKVGLSADNVLVGSGSTELIRLVAATYFGEGDSVIIPQPTYSEYGTACLLAGAQPFKPWVVSEPGFQTHLPKMEAIIKSRAPRGLFICNPNNPTGEYLSGDPVKSVISLIPDALVVVDEAYLAFTNDPWDSTELVHSGHVVILRSMTKDYALPGLRVGYALSSPEIISTLNRVKPPWNVSSVAQVAGEFAIRANGYLEECARRLRESKEFLFAGLRSRGLDPAPSQANFFLLNVGEAARFRKALLGKGILVRDCSSFGLPGYVRLAPRTLTECRKLLDAIDSTEVLSRAG
jgi:histidinol-phosphate aminotransferase